MAVLTPVAFIIANLLLYWSGFDVVWKLGVAIVIGYALIGIFVAFYKDRPPLNGKAASWLPVFLVGMGAISWQGQYGGTPQPHPLPPTSTFNIPFWWEILIVAGSSLTIYYWAQHTRLPRAAMLNLVNRQAAISEEQARY